MEKLGISRESTPVLSITFMGWKAMRIERMGSYGGGLAGAS